MAIEEDNSAAWDPQNPDRLLGDNEMMRNDKTA
jgi:hypothetical protein